MIVLLAGVILLGCFSAVVSFLLYRASKRLLEFDELFGLLEDELDTNSKYMGRLASSPTLMNSPEVIELQQNVRRMSRRLEEFTLRFQEVARKKERVKKPIGPRPSVV